ncbi:hypothetical protein [Amycolatopsis sp. NPDC051128]|uniref:hypothetical protein n=1 Tax=Amycolatopsis sp. NPDC051128 TaxID=3155412 RepID=UPI00343C7B13
MDWAETIEKRLKDLREWKLGLEHPELPVWAEDPLCIAFGIWRSDPQEERRRAVARRLRYQIEQLENEEEREALLVIFLLHRDPDYSKAMKLEDRRKMLEDKKHYGGDRTIKRRENDGISRIASKLARSMVDSSLVFGRRKLKDRKFYIVDGRPMARWMAWMVVIVWTVMVAGAGFAAGMWMMWRYQMLPALEHLK